MNEVEVAVLRNLARYAGAAGEIALKDRLLKEHLGIKSLQMASLITAICDEVDIDLFLLSDLDIIRMKRVRDIIDILSEKKASSEDLRIG